MQDLVKALDPIVREAGRIILSYRFKQLERIEKRDAGFVTQADTHAENFLIEQLTKLDPSISFFTEENGKRSNGSGDYCWVIDPLDGTTNFSYGLPHFCISVALTYKDQPQVGVVYQPLLNEFFYAYKGKGAFLNGQQLKVSQPKSLEESFILFCIPYGKNKESRLMFERVIELSQRAYSLRLLGAAALDQAYVAVGRFDGLFFEQLSWWDVAAGSLLVTEAGGVVSDYQGNPLTPQFTSFIAAPHFTHEKLVQLLG